MIEVAPNEFFVFGTNFRAEFMPKKDEDVYCEPLLIEEGRFENGQWKRGRILNGDEHRITLPFMPQVKHVKMYKY